MRDLRIDLMLRLEREHECRQMRSPEHPQGAYWRCACGGEWRGDASGSAFREHRLAAMLAALDEAAMVS